MPGSAWRHCGGPPRSRAGVSAGRAERGRQARTATAGARGRRGVVLPPRAALACATAQTPRRHRTAGGADRGRCRARRLRPQPPSPDVCGGASGVRWDIGDWRSLELGAGRPPGDGRRGSPRRSGHPASSGPPPRRLAARKLSCPGRSGPCHGGLVRRVRRGGSPRAAGPRKKLSGRRVCSRGGPGKALTCAVVQQRDAAVRLGRARASDPGPAPI